LPESKEQSASPRERALANIISNNRASELLLESVYLQSLLIGFSFVPPAEIIERNLRLLEPQQVLPMLEAISSSNFASPRTGCPDGI
jgi:hypothetical protein